MNDSNLFSLQGGSKINKCDIERVFKLYDRVSTVIAAI